jgi:hypothetical protein
MKPPNAFINWPIANPFGSGYIGETDAVCTRGNGMARRVIRAHALAGWVLTSHTKSFIRLRSWHRLDFRMEVPMLSTFPKNPYVVSPPPPEALFLDASSPTGWSWKTNTGTVPASAPTPAMRAVRPAGPTLP